MSHQEEDTELRYSLTQEFSKGKSQLDGWALGPESNLSRLEQVVGRHRKISVVKNNRRFFNAVELLRKVFDRHTRDPTEQM